MRILITGLGSIGKRHARLLHDYDRSFDLAAYRHGSPGIDIPINIDEYTDLTEALESDPDIAFITNPTHLHVDTALKCARQDCHLFVEKPLSHTLDGVNELISEANKRNLVTLIGCQLRFDPILNEIRDILDRREFGQVLTFRAYSGSYLPNWRPNQDYRNSYSAYSSKGGGVVLDLIHEIDYTHWLFGPPSNIKSEISYVDSLEIDSEAIADILIRTISGEVGNIHLSYCRHQPKRTIEIVCDDGVITGDLVNKEIIKETASNSKVQEFDYGRDTRFKNQLDYFINHVRTETQCRNDLEEGKDVLKTALKIKEGQLHG